MRQECRNEGRYWCEGKQMCSADCSDCTDTVKEWGHNPVNYMWEEVEKVKHFQIPNFETGLCDVACPEATANVEHQSDWGSYTYTQRTPEAYCPLTKRCLRPTNFPYNHDENPVIASMNTVWNDDKSCSEQCGTYSMVKWEWSGQSSRTCIEATKENCAAEWKTWCPTTRQCLSHSDSCKEDCPGMPFKPPHGPDHQKYDSTSCMATKDEVAENARNQTNLGRIGHSALHKCTAILRDGHDARITVIHVLNIKMEKQLRHVTMDMEFVALKVLSLHTLNLLTSTYHNTTIPLQLKRTGQNMKAGLK